VVTETSGFLQGLVDPRLVFTGFVPASMEEALVEMSARIVALGVTSNADELSRRLLDRERLGCTSLGAGIAIPHCKVKDLADLVLAIASCPQGVDFHAPDGVPVTLIFLILSPAQAPALHLQALARISRLLKTPGVADALRSAPNADQLVSALRDAETAVVIGRA
jgi:PTS system nitrogen regulatory IIA component